MGGFAEKRLVTLGMTLVVAVREFYRFAKMVNGLLSPDEVVVLLLG